MTKEEVSKRKVFITEDDFYPLYNITDKKDESSDSVIFLDEDEYVDIIVAMKKFYEVQKLLDSKMEIIVKERVKKVDMMIAQKKKMKISEH